MIANLFYFGGIRNIPFKLFLLVMDYLLKLSPADFANNRRFYFCVNLRYLRENLSDGKN